MLWRCRGWFVLVLVFAIFSQLPPIAMAPYLANMIRKNTPNVACKYTANLYCPVYLLKNFLVRKFIFHCVGWFILLFSVYLLFFLLRFRPHTDFSCTK
jgi:hypothetical protein